jgi:hypothetical protein
MISQIRTGIASLTIAPRWLLLSLLPTFFACSILEKSSQHGFSSGYYRLKTSSARPECVYLDITEEQVAVYPATVGEVSPTPLTTIPLQPSGQSVSLSGKFKKTSLDIDLTTVLFKYRLGLDGRPPELTTDFNAALYAGPRFDTYRIKSFRDPLGKYHQTVSSRGYDFGAFAGLGSTLILPFTANSQVDREYNGMIIQTGLAAFLESNVASFGISAGIDFLLGPDRDIWIYRQKPWLGFIVGIALN